MEKTIGTASRQEIRTGIFRALSKMPSEKLVGIISTYFGAEALSKSFAHTLLTDRVLQYEDLGLEPVDDYTEEPIDASDIFESLGALCELQ